jgi:hypothetical protein
MKKRHEVLAVLAAAAGLSFTPAAQATVASNLDINGQTIEDRAVSDQALSEMIQLAGAKGFERSGNPNAAGSPDKSPQGNGRAQGFDHSGHPNAAGSPDKAPQGTGNAPS